MAREDRPDQTDRMEAQRAREAAARNAAAQQAASQKAAADAAAAQAAAQVAAQKAEQDKIEAARVEAEKAQQAASQKAAADANAQIQATQQQTASDRSMLQGDIDAQKAELARQKAQGGAGAAMAEQMRAANQAAEAQAKGETDVAIQQSIKAARTAGMLPGQAALAALQASGGVYQNAMATGRNAANQAYSQASQAMQTQGQQNIANTLAAMGFSQSGGQATGQQYLGLSQLGQQGALGYAGLSQNAVLQREEMINREKMLERQLREQGRIEEANRQAQFVNQLISGGAQLLGATVLMSDKRAKDDIKPTSFLDGIERVKSKSYRYKGSSRPEAGLIAQDLEKTAMAPAVVENGGVKMIDTGRLSTMNTSAISELNDKVRRLVAELGKIQKPEEANNGRT